MKAIAKVKKAISGIAMLPQISQQVCAINRELGMMHRALGRIEAHQCRQNTGGRVPSL